ncbi:aminopeptidase N [Actinomadura fulvescens]|uniref:Aminopeptidase N n=1 Tax=Actinomadura fulvescens TaxID=46160 RepID=A0ABP6DAP7_9ACTN
MTFAAPLTRAEARERARLLDVHSYSVKLDLTRGDEVFGCSTVIRFAASERGAASFAEIRPSAVRRIVLNGRPLDPMSVARGGRLDLPELDLENVLTVEADMPYTRTGEGMHRFVDPEDGEVYVYANCGPDHAPSVFPCFDQPDLKATFSLSVTAPAAWSLRSNGAERARYYNDAGQTQHWKFAATEPIGTSLLTVTGGPFHSVEAEHDGIELGLHCRRSLARHLDADIEELFDFTRRAFDRFHEVFEQRYAFGKYDQVFVPEMNWGAIEKPGCVLFNERFVFQSAVTDTQRELRATVIAHEMAHMWFGNLVTMRWWDDIWLSESFAEYMGYEIAAVASRFANPWTAFAVARKPWGYDADQRPSTHPVAAESLEDVTSALMNFDGISYAKGASALRQLVAWVGEDAFFQGVNDYFATHRFGNAELTDLLDAIDAAAPGRDVREWAHRWLRTTGIDTLRVDVEGEAVVVSHAGTLRPHRVLVSLYDDIPGQGLVLRERRPAEVTPGSDRTVLLDVFRPRELDAPPEAEQPDAARSAQADAARSGRSNTPRSTPSDAAGSDVASTNVTSPEEAQSDAASSDGTAFDVASSTTARSDAAPFEVAPADAASPGVVQSGPASSGAAPPGAEGSDVASSDVPQSGVASSAGAALGAAPSDGAQSDANGSERAASGGARSDTPGSAQSDAARSDAARSDAARSAERDVPSPSTHTGASSSKPSAKPGKSGTGQSEPPEANALGLASSPLPSPDRPGTARPWQADATPSERPSPAPGGGPEHAQGVRRPALVLLNDGDLTYAKVRLNEDSWGAVKSGLSTIDDSLTRALLWNTARDMVRDGDLPAGEFLALVAAQLPGEDVVAIAEAVLTFTRNHVADRFLPPEHRSEALAIVSGVCRTILRRSGSADDLRLAAVRTLIPSAQTPGELSDLRHWLRLGRVPGGPDLDAELRWQILHQLCALEQAGEADIAAELGRDPSAIGEEGAARCRSALPDPDAKRRAWKLLFTENVLSPRLLAAIARGFWQPARPEPTAGYVERYFDEIPAAGERGQMIAMTLGRELFPAHVAMPETVRAAVRCLEHDTLAVALRRTLADQLDDLQRAVRLRSAWADGADARLNG